MTTRGHKHTPEAKAKMAAATRGHTHSAETKAKMAAARGRELNPSWKGDDIGHRGAHHRHGRALAGQPCAHADETCKGRLECAFNHDTPPEFVKIDPRTGCSYSSRTEDYIRLCRSHHWRYDRQFREPKTHCKRDHEFTPENTWINAAGRRICRTCRRLNRRAQQQGARA